ncbi:MAG TPA: hypothetical protein VM491_05945 [Burkholderiaceae bacterium]|nr:hypothetical protein [Burkholderiaceae bacterium]
MKVDFKKWSALIPVIMLPLGIYLGYRAFRGHSLADVLASVAAIPHLNLAAAFGCAAASYLCLSGFDTLAIRYAGRSLPYRKILLTSFVSLSIGHNVGVAALSSGTLRYRFYSGFGLTGVEVGKIIVFCGITVGLGLMTLGGIALLLHPQSLQEMLGVASPLARAAGVLCLALSAAYVLLSWKLRRPLTIRGHRLYLPSPLIALAQIGIGTLNFGFVAATLHQLLAAASTYLKMVAAYVMGNVAGLISHVPGGLGVLEYVISTLIGEGDVIGALIAFRIVYFVIPLLIGSLLLLASEVHRHRNGADDRRAAQRT